MRRNRQTGWNRRLVAETRLGVDDLIWPTFVHEGPEDRAAVGSIVDLRFDGDDGTERYLLGTIEERHEDYDVVSPSSPLGRAMIGARPGDVVRYEAPAGPVEVTVVDVVTAEDRH